MKFNKVLNHFEVVSFNVNRVPLKVNHTSLFKVPSSSNPIHSIRIHIDSKRKPRNPEKEPHWFL